MASNNAEYMKAAYILVLLAGVLIMVAGIIGGPFGYQGVPLLGQGAYLGVGVGFFELLAGIVLVVSAVMLNGSSRKIARAWAAVALIFSVVSIVLACVGGGMSAGWLVGVGFVLGIIGGGFGRRGG